MMQRILGPLPSDWVRNCSPEAKGFFSGSALRPPLSSSCIKLSRMRSLPDFVERCCGNAHVAAAFLSLLQGLLHYEQKSRLTARDIAAHPFVTSFSPLYHHRTSDMNNGACV